MKAHRYDALVFGCFVLALGVFLSLMLTAKSPAGISALAAVQPPTSAAYLPVVQNVVMLTDTPTSTDTPTPTDTSTPCPTDSSPLPGGCVTITPTFTNTPTPTFTPTDTPTNTPTNTETPTPTETATLTIDGAWSGMTAQRREIDFIIADHGFIHFSVSVQNGKCGTTVTTNSQNPIPIDGNTFVFMQPGSGGSLVRTNGTFTSDNCVSGNVEFTHPSCGDLNSVWTATKQGSPSDSCMFAPTPTPGSNDTGQVAFVSGRDTNLEIYTMNANGSAQTRVITNTTVEVQPSWSPDGARIAFESDRDGNREIYVMNADGSGQTRLTNDSADDSAPAWSPDGNHIAFDSDREGVLAQIFVMNADGTNPHRLTSGNTSLKPDWSPNSTRIVYMHYSGSDWEIHVVNADGSGDTRLTDTFLLDEDNPAWSPDGTKIAYDQEPSDPGYNPQIYVMNANGSNPIRLTSISGNFAPSWSPDGTRIIFTSNRDGNPELYVMNADGTEQTRLTDNTADDLEPDWTP